jgi:hypothetical protein
MRSFIQITDTDNDILRSLPLGDLSSTTTYSFRVWNNQPQADGIAALNGLNLNLMYPPKQGIKTLVNNNVIKIRCTYSGERSQSVSSSFQSFPITGEDYNRLEPNTYNEYEVQIDFSGLTQDQKDSIDLINMEYNITALYDTEFIPFSLPKSWEFFSDSTITVLGNEVQILSDTLIV